MRGEFQKKSFISFMNEESGLSSIRKDDSPMKESRLNISDKRSQESGSEF